MPSDIQDAALGGMKLFDETINQRRRNLAFNALQAAYGDVAGDPEAFGKLDAIKQEQINAPLKTESLRLGNTTAQAKLDADAAAEPDISAQRKAKTAQEQAAAEQAQGKTETDARKRVADGLYATALGVQTAAQRDPASAVSAFDDLAEANKLPPALRAQIRAKIGANPAVVGDYIAAYEKQHPESSKFDVKQGDDGTLYRINASGDPEVLQNGGKTIRGYQAPQGLARIELAGAPSQGAIANAKAVGKAEGENTASDLPLSKTGLAKAKIGLEATMQTFDIADTAIEHATGSTSWVSAGPLSALPSFANPKAAKLRADLTTLSSKVVLDTIQEMKNLSKTGSTGFGQLSDREGELIRSRLGAVEQATTPADLKASLTALKTQLGKSRERVQRAYQNDLEARGQAEDKPTAPKSAPADTHVQGNTVHLKWNAEKGVAE